MDMLKFADDEMTERSYEVPFKISSYDSAACHCVQYHSYLILLAHMSTDSVSKVNCFSIDQCLLKSGTVTEPKDNEHGCTGTVCDKCIGQIRTRLSEEENDVNEEPGAVLDDKVDVPALHCSMDGCKKITKETTEDTEEVDKKSGHSFIRLGLIIRRAEHASDCHKVYWTEGSDRWNTSWVSKEESECGGSFEGPDHFRYMDEGMARRDRDRIQDCMETTSKIKLMEFGILWEMNQAGRSNCMMDDDGSCRRRREDTEGCEGK